MTDNNSYMSDLENGTVMFPDSMNTCVIPEKPKKGTSQIPE